MKTLLTALILLFSTSAFAVQIDGVHGLYTNGGAGSAGLAIYEYYGLWSGTLGQEITLLNSFLPIDSTNHVDGATIPGGLEAYASVKGYSFAATMLAFFQFSYADFQAEIDAGSPVSITTDTSTDWFEPIEVVGVGYDMIDGAQYWGYVSTWSGRDNIVWLPWIEADITHAWGISSVVTLVQQAAPDPVPEPSTFILLFIGMILLCCLKTRSLRLMS